MNKVNVLDKGWVELVDMMPHADSEVSGDLAIVNAARTSFLGYSKGDAADKKLLFYLMKHRHSSPFEMCLAGDTLIPTFPTSTAKQKNYTIASLAEAFEQGGKSNSWVKLINIRTVDLDGVVRATKVKHVQQTGVKRCWKVTEDSALCRSIVVTDNHPFLRPDGSYASILELGVGSEIMMNGTVPIEVQMWDDGYKLEEIALEIGKTKSTTYSKLRKLGVDTSRRKGFFRKEHGEYKDPRALARRLCLDTECGICGGDSHEIHHKDGDPHNNILANLIAVCRSCHKSFHNPALPKITYARKISSIEYVGMLPVYDLETIDENHNFVAGKGFVVHNCEFKFRIKFPLLTMHHWVRHRTWSFNFSSGRYTEFEADDFYMPSEWRKQSTDNKQASDGILFDSKDNVLSNALRAHQSRGFELYENALSLGVAKEQARLFLPAWCNYYTGVLKVDAHNLMHFLKLRMADNAQYEIRVYAKAIYEHFFKPALPWTAEAFEKYILEGE